MLNLLPSFLAPKPKRDLRSCRELLTANWLLRLKLLQLRSQFRLSQRLLPRPKRNSQSQLLRRLPLLLRRRPRVRRKPTPQSAEKMRASLRVSVVAAEAEAEEAVEDAAVVADARTTTMTSTLLALPSSGEVATTEEVAVTEEAEATEAVAVVAVARDPRLPSQLLPARLQSRISSERYLRE